MKQKFYSISLFLSLFTATALLTACADEFDTNYQVEKPASVVEAENLAQYNTLQSYVGDGFHLGNTLASADLDGKTAAASLTLSNFNEVTIPDLFLHSKQVDNEGKIDVLFASTLVADVSEKGINIFSSPLCASANVNAGYLAKLIEPETVEEPEVTGADVIDFENDALGTTYPLQQSSGLVGKGSAVVEDDPKSETGHVVHVTKTTQSFPAITIKFPDGRKLGDYTDISIDYMGKNTTAINQKIFFAMGGKNAEFKSPKDFGCTLNNWGRGKISIDLSAMSYSEEQKQQNEVTIVIGPKLMNCDYLIDNISLKYKYRPTYEVEKTEEEKFLIIGEALDEYITAAMEAAPAINSWAVADCPVTSAPDLIWKQTLHDTYFGYVAHLMREQRSDAKLFVSEYLMDPEVRATFLHLLTADEIGMDQINGIDVLLPIDVASFDVNGFVTMLGELKTTGKLIRLTIQNVTGSDALAADALAQVIATYKKQIPAAQQYGVTFGTVVETANNAGLWTAGFNRKLSYASVAEALK